jgi:VWA domain-containing protein
MATIEEETPQRRPATGRKFTDEEREYITRQVHCAQLQKLDRVLTGYWILQVSGMDDPDRPAGFTTGDAIRINWAWLDHKQDEDLIALMGLNYHELAHVILTPRLRGPFAKSMDGPNVRMTFNIMEDWRIETHFSSMFETAKRYFNVCCRRLIIDDHVLRQRRPEDEWQVALLTMGRFYLDPAIRLRHERLLRQRLQGSSRREEIMESIRMKQMDPDALTVIEQHYEELGRQYADIGLKSRMLAVLDLEGDDRVDRMLELAKQFCGQRWIPPDKQHNRKLILIVKEMALLLPFELHVDKVAGVPQPGNAGNGGLFGIDLPTRDDDSREPDDELQEAGEARAKEMIDRQEEQMKKLRSHVKQMEKDVPEDDEFDLDHPDEDEPDDEDELGDSDDGEDEDEPEDEMEVTGESSGGDQGGDTAPEKRPRGDDILIDPSQGYSDGSETEVETEEEESDEPFAGHLSASAGKGGREPEAVQEKQLTSEELAQLDKIFRDQGVVDEMLTEEIEELLMDKRIQADLKNSRTAVADALGENLDLNVDLNSPYRTVPVAIVHQRDALKRQLEEIQSLLEGSWRDDEPQGKLNIRRWINAPRSQRGHIFRSWMKDEIDEAGMELVILLDRSGSMGAAIDHASQICWMIGSACQTIDGRVHVIGFSEEDEDEVLLSPARLLRTNQYQSFGTLGGTNAAGALRLAQKVMAASNMPNRVVAIITDGSWFDLDKSIPEVHKLNAMDVDTILMLMGMHMERDRRGCKHVVHVNDLERASLELKTTIRKIGEDVALRVAQIRGFHTD